MPYPWQLKSGAFSTERTIALVLSAVPALWLGWRAASRSLGPRPINAAILDTGDYALYLLLATLLVTPLRRITNWPRLIDARQVFGLAAGAYAALHLALHFYEQKFILIQIVSEIFYRLYLGIGAITLIILMILAKTSGQTNVRRLGAEEWNRLHKLIYLSVPAGLLHFFLKAKVEVALPILLSGLYLWLMGWRGLRNRGRDTVVGLLALSIASAGATLALEIVWLALKAGIPASDVLGQVFDFDYEIKSFWWVLAAGISLTGLQALVHRLRPLPRRGT